MEGGRKFWWTIPAADYKKTIEFFQKFYENDFASCSEYIRHKECLVSTKLLREAGIRVTLTIQEKNQIIINMPGAIHFGFNECFNIAVANNFTTKLSLPYLIDCQYCQCSDRSVKINHNPYMYDYLSKTEYRNYSKNFIKPKCFSYHNNLVPVSLTHYKSFDPVVPLCSDRSVKINHNPHIQHSALPAPDSSTNVQIYNSPKSSFPSRIRYDGKLFRLCEVRDDTIRYRCCNSKCLRSLTLTKKLVPRDGSDYVVVHKAACQ